MYPKYLKNEIQDLKTLFTNLYHTQGCLMKKLKQQKETPLSAGTFSVKEWRVFCFFFVCQCALLCQDRAGKNFKKYTGKKFRLEREKNFGATEKKSMRLHAGSRLMMAAET